MSSGEARCSRSSGYAGPPPALQGDAGTGSGLFIGYRRCTPAPVYRRQRRWLSPGVRYTHGIGRAGGCLLPGQRERGVGQVLPTRAVLLQPDLCTKPGEPAHRRHASLGSYFLASHGPPGASQPGRRTPNAAFTSPCSIAIPSTSRKPRLSSVGGLTVFSRSETLKMRLHW